MATAIDEMNRLSPGPGRPAGLPNLLPSEAEQRQWLRKMRASAELGDTTAMSMLIMLARLQKSERSKRATAERLLEAIS